MTISTAAREAMLAQETTEVFIFLLEITHADLPEPIRVALNNQNITHEGDLYIGTYFKIMLPDDTEGVPRVDLEIDNVDRIMVDAIRACTSPPTASLKVVLASSPDTIEIGPLVFTFAEAQYDVAFIRAVLIYENILDEPYPYQSFIPSDFPGLF